MFVGSHELSLDDKNRISIPSSIRSRMVGSNHAADDEEDKVRFYLAPGEHDNTLELFPEDYFPEFVEKTQARLGRSDDAQDFETFFLSVSALVEVDKQGRVLLPQPQLQSAGIGKHIMLLARRDRLIMMNREEGRKFIEKGWSTYRKMRELAELKNGGNRSGTQGQEQ